MYLVNDRETFSVCLSCLQASVCKHEVSVKGGFAKFGSTIRGVNGAVCLVVWVVSRKVHGHLLRLHPQVRAQAAWAPPNIAE